jgi:signal transduction histidine kinase
MDEAKHPAHPPEKDPESNTDRKDAERWTEEQRKELAQLAGTVGHDFNNLLSVISGYADLLRAKLAKAGPVPDELEEIERAASEAAALSRSLFNIPAKAPTERDPG